VHEVSEANQFFFGVSHEFLEVQERFVRFG
jgi:hypothetical protein